MMVTQMITDDDDEQTNVLDLSVNKTSTSSTTTKNDVLHQKNQNFSLLLSPPSSSSSSSSPSLVPSPKITPTSKGQKRLFDNPPSTSTIKISPSSSIPSTNKRPPRFQCKYCDYKAPSTSLMQNHIYRHTDLTPYACAYCGHKSTTKSTIMVHIELCHPNMEVNIIENRVREQDFYRDLNSSEIAATVASNSNSISTSKSAVVATPPPIPFPVNIPVEPQIKKARRSNQYDSESAPINGVAISLKAMDHDDEDEIESSGGSDEISETENVEPMLFEDYTLDEENLSGPLIDLTSHESLPTMVKPGLKLKLPSPTIPVLDSPPPQKETGEAEDGFEYLLVYNRPKQFYGSLYEPDKQYACKLCSYTTNHRPSMEDHVFVHTNEKPYKCGYCGEEIYTRYAATYHIKYKHAGMPRNFIQNKADVTQYYVNRAKRDDEKNQFKVIDTRRVKVLSRPNNKPMSTKTEVTTESSISSPASNIVSKSPSPPTISMPQTSIPPAMPMPMPMPMSLPATTTTASATGVPPAPSSMPPDYRVLLAWSYYLASQAAWLSPMFQQQLPTGQLPTDPQAAAKFLQEAMQMAASKSKSNESMFAAVKKETDQS